MEIEAPPKLEWLGKEFRGRGRGFHNNRYSIGDLIH
jgi:hypothetical protein